jgi:hypothetical protein
LCAICVRCSNEGLPVRLSGTYTLGRRTIAALRSSVSVRQLTKNVSSA